MREIGAVDRRAIERALVEHARPQRVADLGEVPLPVRRAGRERGVGRHLRVHHERPEHEADVIAVRLADLGERLALPVAPRARVLVGDHHGQRRRRRPHRRGPLDPDGVDLRRIGPLGLRRPRPRGTHPPDLGAEPLDVLAKPRQLLLDVLVVLVTPDHRRGGSDGKRERGTHA